MPHRVIRLHVGTSSVSPRHPDDAVRFSGCPSVYVLHVSECHVACLHALHIEPHIEYIGAVADAHAAVSVCVLCGCVPGVLPGGAAFVWVLLSVGPGLFASALGDGYDWLGGRHSYYAHQPFDAGLPEEHLQAEHGVAGG